MKRRRSGIALMLVMWVIVILAVICSSVAMSTRRTMRAAASYRAGVAARYAAESGVTVALATLQDRLTILADSMTRRDYLNHLDRALGANHRIQLGNARTGVVLVDVGSRIDVNMADASSLARLFSFFTNGREAELTARAVRASVERKPMESVDELRRIPGISADVLQRAVPYLTVDGDGTINRVSASDTVRAAATGELRDEPSRILVVSRGRMEGHPLTHEIQAVYAISENELRLIRWQERDL